MIEYIKSDITACTEQLIVHGCNAQGVMGEEVAKAIVKKWPMVELSLKSYYENNTPILGSVYFYFLPDTSTQDVLGINNQRVIANLISQEYFGIDGKKYVSYDALYRGFRRVDTFADKYAITTIAMPRIGVGLGGGDWDIIERIIAKSFLTKNIKVYEL